MIEFNDITLIEGKGDYNTICSIMKQDTSGPWMLRSAVYVSSGPSVTRFLVHLWHHGEVCIVKMDRPANVIYPDDDIRLLRQWVQKSNWSNLTVHNDLVDNDFDFWKHVFMSGLIFNKKIQEYENDETQRLAEMTEEKEDGD